MRNKRKGILMAAAILGSAAIVSTGFAAWVITAEESTLATGQIDVDTVADERITLKATNFNTNVRFGTKASSTGDWLTVRGEVHEVLTVSTTMTIEGGSFLDETTPFSVTLVEAEGSTAYAAASAKNYVAPLSQVGTLYASLETVPSGVSIVMNSEKTSATITIKFAWGSYFGGVNPTDFYNSFAYNSLRKNIATEDNDQTTRVNEANVTDRGESNDLTMANDAAEVLGTDSDIWTALGGASFKLTIAPKRKTSA